MGRRASHRYERKFRVPESRRRSLYELVRFHSALFREVYPPRFVNNVYFDSPGLDDYRRHVDGAATRQKLRLRWYGPESGLIEAALEVKAKDGAVGDKQTCPLGEIDVCAQLDPSALIERVRAVPAPHSLAVKLSSSLPALFNRFHRRYFLSADGRFRITVDEKLVFRSIGRLGTGYLRERREDQLQIVELKYAVADDLDAHRIAAAFPFRVDKISKYVHGLQGLSGVLER